MKKNVAVFVTVLFLSAVLAGCIGDGFGGGGPRAVVSVTQVNEDTFVFDARESSGRGLTYEWEFGDGTTSTDARVEHHFQYGDATYDVKLTITDENDVKDLWEDGIVVGSGVNRPPVALFSTDKRNYLLNEPVRVDARASFDPEGDPLIYRWDFNYLLGDYDTYEDFRFARQQALEDLASGGDGTGGGNGNGSGGGAEGAESDPGGSLLDWLGNLDPRDLFNEKHPGHGGGDEDRIQPSLFTHTVETEEPVYVLDQGYPDATTFFIRLQVMDVKGGYQNLVSEEIWAVMVHSESDYPDQVIRGADSGGFSFGVMEELEPVADELPEESLAYETVVTFEVDWPVALPFRQGDAIIDPGFINLTWEAESDSVLPPDLPLSSELEMNLTTPSGFNHDGFRPDDNANLIRVTLDGFNQYHADDWEDREWKVQIIARAGMNIEWNLEWWITLDTNPFSLWEDDYPLPDLS